MGFHHSIAFILLNLAKMTDTHTLQMKQGYTQAELQYGWMNGWMH